MTSYTATLESLKKHQVPDWFHDAKLGALIVWGLYSVPGWAPASGDLGEIIAQQGWEAYFRNNPYAEWYLHSMHMPDSPTQQHHRETYGEDFKYDDFVPMFEAALANWDPTEWADLFKQSGVQYTVMVTKHCDSYLMWPSETHHPIKGKYQSERDLVGETAAAMREQAIRFGVYYCSGMDWTFEDDFLVKDAEGILGKMPQSDDYVRYTHAHWLELIQRYKPAVMWGDIGYPTNDDPKVLFAEYLNTVPEGVINDRFAKYIPDGPGLENDGVIANPGGEIYDFRTPEYTQFKETQEVKWESTRGLAHTFSFNRNETDENYLPVDTLIQLFVDIVSKNGNLLLSFGPEADGSLPAYQRERFLALGKWLNVNGEGIYGTRPWQAAEGQTDVGLEVRFTRKDENVYAFLMGTPTTEAITLQGLQAGDETNIHLLGHEDPLQWEAVAGGVRVMLPGSLPDEPAHGLRLAGSVSII
jgi:alpha-L-fucosidase